MHNYNLGIIAEHKCLHLYCAVIPLISNCVALIYQGIALAICFAYVIYKTATHNF